REAADVDERLDTRLAQALEQLLDRPRPVPDGVDQHDTNLGLKSPAPGKESMVADTVSWDQLRDLAGFRARKGCAISIFLNLDPALAATAPETATKINSLLDE